MYDEYVFVFVCVCVCEREREVSLHIHHNLAEEHVFQSQHCLRVVNGVKAFKCFIEIRKCCFKVFFFSM